VRRVTVYDDGPDVTLLDAQGQWLETYSSYDRVLWTLVENPSPMGLGQLLAEGVDEYDFTQRSADGSVQHVRGTDRLTGTTTVIDGTPMRSMTFDTEVRDGSGALIQHYRGTNHVAADPAGYYGGPSEDLVAQATWDSTPLDLVRPGEPGFLSVAAPASCIPASQAAAQPAEPAR
jgi:hypothetical protein